MQNNTGTTVNVQERNYVVYRNLSSFVIVDIRMYFVPFITKFI